MERELDKIKLELNKKLNVLVVNGVQKSWLKGEKNAGMLVQAQYGQTTQSIAQIISDRATQSARQAGKTAHNFTLQKTNGLNISNRVWNCNANFKSEMTAIIQNSMLQGLSAQQTASQVQKYLKNPTALFRRVRNKKTGELELSAAARKYHPGRGVYRSAFKNAMRLARTEINVAYRQAEWESYQKNPLVSGFEIRLSGNHTCLVKGIPRPFVDICDYKAGKYPKSFQWHGWHPQCRCIMIPIVMRDSEFVDFLANKDAKDVKQWIKTSKQTEDWLKELEEREELYRNNIKIVDKNNHYVPKSVLEKTAAKDFDFIQLGDVVNNKMEELGCAEVSQKIVVRGDNVRLFMENNIMTFAARFKKIEKQYLLELFSIRVKQQWQKKGIAKTIIANVFSQSEEKGINKIKFTAKEDGSYAWAKLGFIAKNKDNIHGIKDKRVEDIIRQFYMLHDKNTPFPMQIIANQEWGEKVLKKMVWISEIDF